MIDIASAEQTHFPSHAAPDAVVANAEGPIGLLGEHDQVGGALAQILERLLARRRGAHLVAGTAQ